MQLTVDIIDSLDDTLVLRYEKAVGGSMILNWKGGDLKDDIYVLGSSFDFEMLGMSCEDGQYSDLFTGNETRYRVKLYTPEATLWQGFILPDAYSEPYVDGPIPVKFRATDGLGRLKGKYLPDDFYEEEKSVIKILAKCLELTGVGLNFRFAPAIENSVQKDYDQIYIDTSLFKNGDKKDDAHAILDSLLKSMLCSLFQADNYYNIEGFNIRNFRVYQTKVYSVGGYLIEEQEVTRLRKDLTATKPTNVSIQPPYGTIRVTHKREPIALPETIATEKNDGWVQMENVNDPIYATDWFGHNGSVATTGKDLTVGFDRYFDGVQAEGYISLKKRLYVKKGQKLRLKMHLELVFLRDISSDEKQAAYDAGAWKNPFPMDLRLYYPDGEVQRASILLRNYLPDADSSLGRYFPLEFDLDGKVDQELQFIPNRSGELDIRMFYIRDVTEQISFIYRVDIKELELEEIGFEEEFISEIAQDGYTTKKELELDFADDASGLSKSFRLQKLNALGNFNTVDIPVQKHFQRDGFWYAYVDLKGANLIKDNIDTIQSNGQIVEVLDVIYNYNNSQEHAVKLASALPLYSIDPVTFQFTVFVYDFNSVTEDRGYWEQWSDSRYKIEQKRYCDVASSILDLQSRSSLFRIDYTLIGNVKINDFLIFGYRGLKQYLITSCKWDLDKGLTQVTSNQAFYGVEAGQNLPPVVEAGEDIYIGPTITGRGLRAEAYDPDGFIVSYFWEEITSNGAWIPDPYNSYANIFNLDKDYYEFRVTVTDNDGATASDTVKMYREQAIELSLEETDKSSTIGTLMNEFIEYTLRVDPEISQGSALNIQGSLQLEGSGTFEAYVSVYQNGDLKGRLRGIRGESGENPDTSFKEFPNIGYSLNYNAGDIITFTIDVNFEDGKAIDMKGEFAIELVEFVEGTGTVTGFPLGKYLAIDL